MKKKILVTHSVADALVIGDIAGTSAATSYVQNEMLALNGSWLARPVA